MHKQAALLTLIRKAITYSCHRQQKHALEPKALSEPDFCPFLKRGVKRVDIGK